jgi:predicted Zn-ribbon and HTH transcriptional regulator
MSMTKPQLYTLSSYMAEREFFEKTYDETLSMLDANYAERVEAILDSLETVDELNDFLEMTIVTRWQSLATKKLLALPEMQPEQQLIEQLESHFKESEVHPHKCTDYALFDFHSDPRKEPTRCPVCGSWNIAAGRFDFLIGQAWRTVECHNSSCKFRWQEEYVFVNWEPIEED